MLDAELLDRCRRGDQRAWDSLVERYERLVFSIALSLGLNRDDAADVTQATFGAFLAALDRIEQPERIKAWLSTVARRESIRIVARLAKGHHTETDRLITDDDHAQSIVGDVEWLHQGLATLSAKCQELLIGQYFSGGELSYDDLAAQLGMPVGSIGPTRQRCLDRLRRALADLM